jgi:hypothetical protein
MAWAIVARRALSPSTPRAQGAPLRVSGVDRLARPSKWRSCQQCEDAPLGLPRSIFNRHPPEVSITEICYQFRVSHMGCSPERTGHMGCTFRFCSAGGVDAVESEFGDGRASALCRSSA